MENPIIEGYAKPSSFKKIERGGYGKCGYARI